MYESKKFGYNSTYMSLIKRNKNFTSIVEK